MTLTLTGLPLESARQVLNPKNALLTVEVTTGSLADVMAPFRSFVVALIERFIRMRDLVIGDDLQNVVDQGLYSPQLSGLFEKLWSARFEHEENRDTEALVNELVHATFEDLTPPACNDAFLFWLSLMGQNYVVDRGKLNLIIHGSMEPDLSFFIVMAEIWQPLGSPLQILILN
jgi:hypothetical protein